MEHSTDHSLYPKTTALLFASAASLVYALLLTVVVLLTLLLIGLAVPEANRIIPPVLGGIGGGYLLFLLVMTVSLLRRRELLPLVSIRYLMMKYLVPAAKLIAEKTGHDKEKIVRTFIDFNNGFVLRVVAGGVRKVLVLLPHCIQLAECDLRLTYDIEKCTGCGRCEIKNLVQISRTYNLDMNVATGGTMARRLVKEKRPDVILAVACERDLLSGIRDSLPLPVLGVTNERPFGPCLNTTVNSRTVSDMIEAVFKAEP